MHSTGSAGGSDKKNLNVDKQVGLNHHTYTGKKQFNLQQEVSSKAVNIFLSQSSTWESFSVILADEALTLKLLKMSQSYMKRETIAYDMGMLIGVFETYSKDEGKCCI